MMNAILLMVLLHAMTLAVALATDDEIVLESFDDPQHKWVVLNDPVMGGKSTGNITIADGKARFRGKVAIVPYLEAPGFITIQSMPRNGIYPDVSSCTSLWLEIQAHVEYSGYRVSFGRAHVPGGRFAYGYKSNMTVPVDKVQRVTIPFTDFTDKWDDATGNAIVTCQEDSQYCPTPKVLRNVQTITLWGEGVEGTVDLEITAIGASGCASENGNEQEAATNNSDKSTTDNESILIEDFDNPSLTWTQKNDPGTVANVPFLDAPGFIQVVGTGEFPDVSSCRGLALDVMSSVPYEGYRFSFGRKSAPGSMIYIHGFKTDVDVSADGSFQTVKLSFEDCSDKWDPGTGDQITTCAEDPQFCPDSKTLQNMKELAIWGEGVAGEVNLSIRSIRAIGCNQDDPVTSSVTRVALIQTATPMIAMLGGMALVVVATVVGAVLSKLRKSSQSQIVYEEIPESKGAMA